MVKEEGEVTSILFLWSFHSLWLLIASEASSLCMTWIVARKYLLIFSQSDCFLRISQSSWHITKNR